MPDKKYHGAIVEVLDHVKSLIKDGAKVLEIGPGHVPFSKATHFCGWTLEEKSKLQNYKVANVSVDVLPYSNKEFDFVYCRHVIEDLWNPSHCLNEISRVAKEGWIETPSPLCEMTKNVDGSESVTTPWRGYAHHRYMVWNDNDVLKILPKFPMVAKPLGPLAPKLYEGRQIQDLLTLGHVPVAAVAEGWTKVQEHLVNVT
jgi:ubiquinone/menaquinone biosynthesis C-methylase UbiE